MQEFYAQALKDILEKGKTVVTVKSTHAMSKLRAGLSNERKKQEMVDKIFGDPTRWEDKQFRYKRDKEIKTLVTVTLEKVVKDDLQFVVISYGEEKISTDLGIPEEETQGSFKSLD